MDRAENHRGGPAPAVLVDYAHTDDALKRSLEAARALAKGRVIVVFGCGGDRDKGKRPLMGAVAAEGADLVVVTSDNPRTEDPEDIISRDDAGPGEGRPAPHLRGQGEERGEGLPRGGGPPRRHRARSSAWPRTDDVVLIAGKGHETYQIDRHARSARSTTARSPARALANRIPRLTPRSATTPLHGRSILRRRGGAGDRGDPRGRAPAAGVPGRLHRHAVAHARVPLRGAAGRALRRPRLRGTAPRGGRGRGGGEAGQGAAGRCPRASRSTRWRTPWPRWAAWRALHRRRFRIPVAAVGGSNGKTTTKEMVGAILATRGPALKTEGNLNNEVGVPLTLFRLEPVARGGGHRDGDEPRRARSTRLTAGRRARRGRHHRGPARAPGGPGQHRGRGARPRASCSASCSPEATAVVNLDDALIVAPGRAQPARSSSTFGRAAGRRRAARATSRRWAATAWLATVRYRRAATGRCALHFVGDAQRAERRPAAFALALGAGLLARGVRAGPGGGAAVRAAAATSWTRRSGVTVVDDCYNANPASMDAALRHAAHAGAARGPGGGGAGRHAGAGRGRGGGARAAGRSARAGTAQLVAFFGPRSQPGRPRPRGWERRRRTSPRWSRWWRGCTPQLRPATWCW